MNDTDYKAVLNNAILRMAEISRQKEELENEVLKLRQFIMAAINMLPDSDRSEFVKMFEVASEGYRAVEESLKQAIMKVLRDANPEWLTVAQVRDRLVASGFNFSGYMSNPLASVATTLRRLKPEEAEANDIQGVNAFRISRLADRVAKAEAARQRKVAAGALKPGGASRFTTESYAYKSGMRGEEKPR